MAGPARRGMGVDTAPVTGFVGLDPVDTVAGVAQRNYQRWRSVQDEIFKTLMNATGRGDRAGEDKPSAETPSHQ